MKKYTMTFTEDELILIRISVFERSYQLSDLKGNEHKVKALDEIYDRIADELKGGHKS